MSVISALIHRWSLVWDCKKSLMKSLIYTKYLYWNLFYILIQLFSKYVGFPQLFFVVYFEPWWCGEIAWFFRMKNGFLFVLGWYFLSLSFKSVLQNIIFQLSCFVFQSLKHTGSLLKLLIFCRLVILNSVLM